MRYATGIAMLLVIMLAGGCATYRAYPGKKRPKAEVAVLSVPTLTQYVVDGEPAPAQSVSKIELLPGRHEVEWTFTYPNDYREPQQVSFRAEAGQRYRLGQRFFPAPHPGGPLVAVLELGLNTALIPFKLLLPLEAPTEPPEGEYYRWVVEVPSQRLMAGMAPDVPLGHATITYVPIEGD